MTTQQPLLIHDTRHPEGDGLPMRYTEGPRKGEIATFETDAQARLWLAIYGIEFERVIIAPAAE